MKTKKKYEEVTDREDLRVGDTIILVDDDCRVTLKSKPFKITSLYDQGYIVGVDKLNGDQIETGGYWVHRLVES